MVDPQLMDYVRQQTTAGVSREEITKTLIATGWKDADVQEAFANVSAYSQPAVAPAQPTVMPQTPVQSPVTMPTQAPADMQEPIVVERAVEGSSAGKLIGIFFAVVILCSAGLVAAYYFHLLDSLLGIEPTPTLDTGTPPATTTPQVLPEATTTDMVASTTAPVATTTPVVATTTSSTATTTAKVKPVVCTTIACFTPLFAACTQGAQYQADAGMLGAVTYTLNGPATGGCSVTLLYTRNPSASWVNKPLTCVVNSAQAFETTIESAVTATAGGKSTCTGTLVPLLRAK